MIPETGDTRTPDTRTPDSQTPALYHGGRFHNHPTPETDVTSDDSIGFDWVSITGTCESHPPVEAILTETHQGPNKQTRGQQGYRRQTVYPSGVQFFTDGPEGRWWVQIPGSACAALGGTKLFDLVQRILPHGRCRRLDIRRDVKGSRIKLIGQIQDACNRGQMCYLHSFKAFLEKDRSGEVIGEGMYLGSSKSDRFVRVYDKGLERGTLPRGAWVRFESQMRNQIAEQAAAVIFTRNCTTSWHLVAQVYMTSVVDFRTGTDHNLSRRPRAAFWFRFAETHQIMRPSTTRDPSTVQTWANALRRCFGGRLSVAAQRAGCSIETMAAHFLQDVQVPESAKTHPLVGCIVEEFRAGTAPAVTHPHDETADTGKAGAEDPPGRCGSVSDLIERMRLINHGSSRQPAKYDSASAQGAVVVGACTDFPGSGTPSSKPRASWIRFGNAKHEESTQPEAVAAIA